MNNEVTGGHYSLFRVAFGLYLLGHLLQLAPYAPELFSNEGTIAQASDSPLALLPNILVWIDAPGFTVAFVLFGAALAIPFALGVRDRVAAVLLWYVWACLFGRNPLIANPGLPYVGWMLLAHLAVPRAPYGSWPATQRNDPGGDWKMPPLLFGVAWFLMAAGYTFSGVTKLISPSWIDGTAVLRVLENPLARPTFLREWLVALPHSLLAVLTYGILAWEVAFLPLAVFRRLRFGLWIGMLSMHVGIMVLVDFVDLTLGMVMLHLFTLDPKWLRPLHGERTELVFYDGYCGLCHRAIRFILAEDRSGAAFRFAPLQGETFEATVPPPRRGGLPDSVIVWTDDGQLLVKSSAMLYIAQRLGGMWRIGGFMLEHVVPRFLRDAVYDGVAAVRHKIFAKPDTACPILPPALRARFDP